MDLQSNPVNEILYVNFNQDCTCFVCGTENGFRVYSTDPFRLVFRRDFDDGGGLGVVCMLFRTNILAFSGGGKNPRFQPHKVVIWDDRQVQIIADLRFRCPVKSVRLRRDLVVVALINKVFVYGFRSLSLVDSIETTSNPRGLCCLSAGDRVVLVCPGMQLGSALVVFYPRNFSGDVHAPAARERTMIIAAHKSSIAAMAMDYSCSFLATASEKGTIVRVYSTTGESRPQELRRGLDRAEINSLTFSPSGDYLVAASDKGTVHIFAINRAGAPASSGGIASESIASSNSKSSLQWLSWALPAQSKAYVTSEWSLAQFRVHDYRFIAAFGADPHTVVIVCANGSYYKARFDPVKGGEMVREEFEKFDDASTGTSPGTVVGALPEPLSSEIGEAVSSLTTATRVLHVEEEEEKDQPSGTEESAR